MKAALDGNAIVYCEKAFNTTNGKTAHGLVRFTKRYRVLSVVDSRYAGKDAGETLDGRRSGIPVLGSIGEAIAAAAATPATHLVVGLAPDGGRLDAAARADLLRGIGLGLNVDCGLHDFLSDDPEIAAAAAAAGVRLRDVRKVPREGLHFFTGKIEEVAAVRVALLGTDSAVGKRTTAWILLDALEKRGYRTEMVGTGQTAWMQGAAHCIILDSLVNDFVSGEIEHAVWSAWKDTDARVVLIEGQGSLMNPAYPGGFEILAAGRPHAVILQHAPARRDYDGFPGYPIQPIEHQIRAIEVVSGRRVVAVSVNHEGLDAAGVDAACADITRETGLPAVDPLLHGADELAAAVARTIER
ncbi:MAG: DUF1611 domain-containing protein [Candidatus Krumholzibacteriota bacterium]|nr:DUF1611 domain-containing protein [Candidatus Krumholzibacteriota bacterium]